MRSRLHGPSPVLGRTLLAVQALAALVFLVALLHAEGVHLPLVSSDGYRVRVVLTDAGGMPPGRAAVLVSGVPAGHVTSVAVRGDRAVATLRLDDDVRGKLHRDATAVVEPRSALEDMTLDLRPGSPSAPALPDGATIAAARTTAAVSPDRVISILDTDTRSQVAVILDQLAVATRRAPGSLRAAVLRLRPAVAGATRVTAALGRRRALLTRLVGAVDRLSSATALHDTAITSTIDRARQTLAVTARQDRALRTSIGELPATLASVDGALTGVQSLARPLDPALERLRPVARAAPATLAALRGALPAANGLLGAVDALGRDGAAPARSLTSILTRLRPAATQLQDPAVKLGSIVRSIDARKAGIGQLGENFSGVLSTNDANGPILRGLGFFESFDPANFGVAGATGKELATVKAGIVRALVHTCLHDNPVACLVRYLVPGLPGATRTAKVVGR